LLDPHFVQVSFLICSCLFKFIQNTTKSFEGSDLDTYFCKKFRTIPAGELDPSVTIGFYIKSRAEFNDLIRRIKEVDEHNSIVSMSPSRHSEPTLSPQGQTDDAQGEFEIVE
jgi:hypothetical protein